MICDQVGPLLPAGVPQCLITQHVAVRLTGEAVSTTEICACLVLSPALEILGRTYASPKVSFLGGQDMAIKNPTRYPAASGRQILPHPPCSFRPQLGRTPPMSPARVWRGLPYPRQKGVPSCVPAGARTDHHSFCCRGALHCTPALHPRHPRLGTPHARALTRSLCSLRNNQHVQPSRMAPAALGTSR